MPKRTHFQVKCELLRSLATELMCHNCKNVPSPYENGSNRYQCKDHAQYLCDDCKNKSICATNSKPSPIIGKILSDLPWFCCNFVNGCKEIMWEESLKEHQRKCEFRYVPCPNIHCNDMIVFKQYSDHIEFACETFSEGISNEIDQNRPEHTTLIPTILKQGIAVWEKIKHDEKIFWLFLMQEETDITEYNEDNKVHLFVKFAKDPSDTKDYEFVITGIKDDLQERLFSHSVFSFDDCSDDIIKNHPELSFDKTTLKKFEKGGLLAEITCGITSKEKHPKEDFNSESND